MQELKERERERIKEKKTGRKNARKTDINEMNEREEELYPCHLGFYNPTVSFCFQNKVRYLMQIHQFVCTQYYIKIERSFQYGTPLPDYLEVLFEFIY